MPEAESGANRLSEEVLSDAKRKAERRRRSAKREADKILKDSDVEAKQAAEHVVEEAGRRADRQRNLILATVGQEVQRRRMLRQASLLEDLIQAGFDRAADRHNGDLRGALLGLTVSGIEQMDAPAFRLQVAAVDRDLLDHSFLAEVGRRLAADEAEAPELAVDDGPAPIAGGVIVRAADGTQMVDNSFEARRRRVAPQLRQALAGMVFPDRDEPSDE